MFSIFSKKIYLVDLLSDYVDIHNHILPGIDDGAKTISDSLEMLRSFKSLGVTTVICTPHTMSDYYPNTPKSIQFAIQKIQHELKNNSSLDSSIKASSEYMMDENFESLLENNTLMPLKDNYLLVEMSYLQPPYNLDEVLFKIGTKDYKPILAHPERYSFYHNKLAIYKHLKTLGCSFQLNLLSLTSHYGTQVQKVARLLLKENLIDFVGTDAHRVGHIEKIKTIKLSTTEKKLLEPIILANNETFSF